MNKKNGGGIQVSNVARNGVPHGCDLAGYHPALQSPSLRYPHYQTYSVLIVILAVAALVVFSAQPARAQENGFSETFDDPTLPGWERHPDATSIVDGVLQINPGGFASVLAIGQRSLSRSR